MMWQSLLGALLCVALLCGSACGGSDSDSTSTTGWADVPVGVTSTVVSDGPTRQLSVWAPETEGSWPIVYAVHGMCDTRDGMAAVAAALASQGFVVFAPTYRSTEPEHRFEDLAWGYQYTVNVADQYGGDLDQPVTFIGHSLGASMVLSGGLGPDPTEDAPHGHCLAGPRPDVIVAIAGCYYEYPGERFDEFHPSGWMNLEADVVLIAGEDDTICEPWQSHDATEALQSVGYNATLVTIADATHQTLVRDILHSEVEEVAQTILDAINTATA